MFAEASGVIHRPYQQQCLSPSGVLTLESQVCIGVKCDALVSNTSELDEIKSDIKVDVH